MLLALQRQTLSQIFCLTFPPSPPPPHESFPEVDFKYGGDMMLDSDAQTAIMKFKLGLMTREMPSYVGYHS